MKGIFYTILLAFFPALVLAQDGSGWPDGPEGDDILRAGRIADRPGVEPGRVFLTRKEIDALILSRGGSAQQLPTLEQYTGNEPGELEFRRIALAAPGTKARVLADGSETILPRGKRDFYLATNRSTGLGLAVDRESGEVRGFVKKYDSRLEIQGNLLGALQFSRVDESGSASCGTAMGDQPIDAATVAAHNSVPSQSQALQGETISYEAVVAVETDNEWLDGFNDDEVAAYQWIEDAFLAMNVFFERDVETRLLIGDVFLRTTPDPYSVGGGNRSGQLDEFGAYWKDNMGHIDRQFAAMFSGRDVSSRYFSGIAWVDQYCDYGRTWGGRTPGSYSYNAIGSSRSAAGTALYIGHELGHNMGSPHTHCYDPPVDECYGGEGGCFSGTPSCPSGGRGTIMSYCHILGGCSNVADFHPTVQSLIEDRMATELAAGCILPYSEPLGPEIDTSPVAGTPLNLGQILVGETGTPFVVHVDNSGDEALNLSCGIAGANPSSFSSLNCGQTIAAGDGVDISVQCTPAQVGSLSADLQLNSNDADEAQLTFALACQGLGEQIFSDNFEN